MALLNPYIAFDGTTAEAMDFYQSVFGGELTLNTYSEYGDTGPTGNLVMHSMLETRDGMILMASDVPPGTPHRQGDNVSICLSADENTGLRAIWQALIDGGTVTQALETQPWGDDYGSCIDRFGIVWRVNINRNT